MKFKKTGFLIIFLLVLNIVYAEEKIRKEFNIQTPDFRNIKIGNYDYFESEPNYLIRIVLPGESLTFSNIGFIDKDGTGISLFCPGYPEFPSEVEEKCFTKLTINLENQLEHHCKRQTGGGFSGFKCEIPEALSPGKYKVYFNYNIKYPVGSSGIGGGSSVPLNIIIQGCGDKVCYYETQQDCCTDCGTPDLYKCEDNKLISTCGNGLCEESYKETKENCCSDCGAPELKKCENNKLVDTCGNNQCESNYFENQQNCCSDCGTPLLYKCEDNNLVDSCGDKNCEAIHGENKDSCCTDCGAGFFYRCVDNIKKINYFLIIGLILGFIILITVILFFYRRRNLSETEIGEE